MDALTERYTFWASQMEELLHWNQYFVRTRRAKELGLGGLVERFETGTIDPEGALHCFDRVYYSQLLREFMRQNPALAQFDGVLHERRVEAFCELDKERLALSRHRVLMAHFDRLPPAAGVGPVGILRGEMERKRGHRTVRRLLKDAGSVVQAIKPVFMMSPLSVAQFLEPGTVEFDLLVVDEASQVQPVDALGAIARCNQIVVVGDSRQLPPTRFFTRMTSDVPELEDEEASANVAEARDVESILGLCCARGLPQTMLRWHYRSRHHSLIAVSNHEFYEDRLFIVPSPHPSSSGLGLRFNPVPEGVFDSGASGTNRVEAKAVCNAVIEHARQSPELSLGVAAFSVRQQQAILDELELLRRENPDTESFFSSHADEPFFIKNLENVQGDERDVIFISVGYGKNAHGYMAMRFGPLSNEGGERRLNVLISRAKNRCEVFSSIVAEDIDLERASGRGVAALKTFLTYAKTDLLAVATNSGREEESPFEEAVRRAIESLGHEVHPQVGVAGFYIDLAVRDPAQPGHYLLGIECDGATYHSSRSARDRDRLRQAVLEDHGWTIHRIWSTDWFQHPAEQLRKVQQAIEGAKERGRKQARPDTAPTIASDHDDDTEPFERENANEMEDAGLRDLAAPYIEANFPVPERKDPHEINTSELAEIVLRIVREEGPVHEDEVVARVRDLWGLGRAGNRIQDSVAKAIRSILVTGACTREHGFLSISGLPVRIRNRQNVSSPNLRKPDTLPPAEIRAAILALIDANHGATVQEIPVAVARIFGFKSTSSQLRSAIEAQTAKLQRQALIQEGNGMLKRTQP
jgi:very-short-patch-repair endonuclease